jgi:hypothetical protein
MVGDLVVSERRAFNIASGAWMVPARNNVAHQLVTSVTPTSSNDSEYYAMIMTAAEQSNNIRPPI